ncbi:class I SAM-dependent methyltransferase [Lysinibacter cavernae]|uniref:Ubiquinone/menaquinone biosynthesis C-methylase UbiE n=1 Tax=Lysinibacter cavernae TaxID=1640652 RepID=A0A7X5R1Q2_9MICO|nr:class I SAM-dependent methyltransferase [Lysinibacter cavernae]NIH54075.1 ubiquinone/menaquinone biosynthesis C-methylase UbiE [Lysinibacter cavernae]
MTTRSNERYTHGHHASVLKSHSWRTIENSAEYLRPFLASGLSLLDIGCGPGTITVEFADALAPAEVIGLDAAAEVIEKATSHATEQGTENVTFVVGDAYALPYDDESFDIVHSHQTLQHLADPVAALREMHRVLKPGGLLAVRDADYAGTITYPESDGLTLWQDVYQQVHRSNGGEPNAGRHLKAWVNQVGFSEVEAVASIWCFANDTDREWWGSMWEARALQSAFAGDAVGRGFATEEQLHTISKAWRAWADDADGWMSMPHGEILARK